MDYKTKRILPGLGMIAVNAIYFYQFAFLFYSYHYTSVLYFFMYPDWILIMNMLFATIGIRVGFRLAFSNISMKQAIRVEIPVLTVGFLTSLLYPSF